MRKSKIVKELTYTVNKLQELADEYEELKSLAFEDHKKAEALAEILKAQSNIYAAKIRALKMFKEIEKLDVDIKEKKGKSKKAQALQLKIEFTDLEETK